jgi:hypothetical protein
MMRTLDAITEDFGDTYATVKDVTKEKTLLQNEFFAAATAELETRQLARKTVMFDIERYGATNMTEWVTIYHPGWRFIEVNDQDLLIEEDPALLSFTYVNKIDKTVYGRDTVRQSPQLDDERLREEDPDLWQEISSWPEPWYSLVYGAMKTARYCNDVDDVFLNDADMQLAVETYLRHEKVQRVLRPIDELDDEQIEALQEYLVPGSVSVKLRPPREAKEEEL